MPGVLIVPNVVGQYYYDAQQALLTAQLRIARPKYIVNLGVLPGYVTTQSLTPGSFLSVDSQTLCEITVSKERVIQGTLSVIIASGSVAFPQQGLMSESSVGLITESVVLLATEGGVGRSPPVTAEVNNEPLGAQPVAWAWSFLTGGAGITIDEPTSQTTTFTAAPGATGGVAQCTVTDTFGATGSGTISVRVAAS